MRNQLELREVTVRYGEVTAVDAASLSVQRGQIGCLLGPSGCGKTTLLRAIAGFEPLSGGDILLGGALIGSPLGQVPPEQRRVGMVFQDFALFPHLDVRRNIAFGLNRLARAERERRVDEMLALVELEAHAAAHPHELSGGQQQRVALARALAPGPDLLLLDEPFSSLDSELREQLAGEVRALLTQRGVTAILVTHDQHEAFAMADQVALMRQGKIVQCDTPYNLYHHPANEFVAQFIGQGCIVTLTADASGQAGGAFGLAGSGGWRAGETRRVLLRPDNIRYAPGSTLHLAVASRSFRGSHCLYQLLLPDGQHVPCIAPADATAREGDSLPVVCALDTAQVFD
ncbi:MAG: ABC transporter ATP-binding protein [Halioglobus sp.]|nr:ABC transporter ATP-binding protein [Halioglobus sp.]